jgi:hypothetical protein
LICEQLAQPLDPARWALDGPGRDPQVGRCLLDGQTEPVPQHDDLALHLRQLCSAANSAARSS